MRNIFKGSLFLSVMAMSMLVTQKSWSDDRGFSIGALGGLGVYGRDIGAKAVVGGELMYRVVPSVKVGFQGVIAPVGDMRGAGTSSSIATYTAAMNWHLLDMVPGLWVGVRAGVSHYYSSLTSNYIEATTTFAYGVAAGYDFELSEMFSIGVDMSVLAANGNPTTFYSLAAAKFHF